MHIIEQPKPQKSYDWRCINTACQARVEATANEGQVVRIYGGKPEQIEFRCPCCGFRTTVDA